VVKHQPSFYFIVIRKARALPRPYGVPRLLLAGPLPFRLAAREPVATARQFLDGDALPELLKHLEQRAIVGLFQMETLHDLARGRGLASNLQKTQYVIGAEV
jgi:hypothetical protein